MKRIVLACFIGMVCMVLAGCCQSSTFAENQAFLEKTFPNCQVIWLGGLNNNERVYAYVTKEDGSVWRVFVWPKETLYSCQMVSYPNPKRIPLEK